MARVTHEWVTAGEDVVHVLDFGGTGRPVLFLHGVGGGAWTWEPVLEHLPGDLRLLSADLPGYGESRWRADGDYASRSLAATLGEVLRTLAAEPADVVGFSWGGLVGLALAAQRPSAVRRLAVLDIPPSTPLSDTDIPRLPVTFADQRAAVAASRGLAPRATDRVLRRDAAHLTRPGPDGGYHRKMDPRLTHRWPFRAEDLWPELAAFPGPLLVVRAEQSPNLPAEVAERMVAVAPDAVLHTVADCGHLIPLERPAELAAALAAFLRP
ncbi:alpha/beta fold hydrolase [Plantactinospora sp. GCM10030261]|uniref:alpha/beta fold hydrolase n=1 Tax=Plantactinospora sp. GCM10030261 TaxID=3273420 RepID=UPI00361D0B18